MTTGIISLQTLSPTKEMKDKIRKRNEDFLKNSLKDHRASYNNIIVIIFQRHFDFLIVALNRTDF